MESHHQESIEKFLARYASDETILAILLGGSIAHGFAHPDSDIDLMLIVEESEFQKRKADGKLAFSLWDICTYPGGYVDCKVLGPELLHKIGRQGSDPARYAFQDSVVLFSKMDNLAEILADIIRFPVQQKESRRNRFAAQLLAWRWYYSEGIKKKNKYLVYLAIQKLVLFASRIILNENEMLYPYHKWVLRETEQASIKPIRFADTIQHLLQHHSIDSVNGFCDQILQFLKIDEQALDWPNHFLRDSEMTWLHHEPPIDDL